MFGFNCSRCGAHNDDTTNPVDGGKSHPEAEDLTVCAYCGELAIFINSVGTVRRPTAEEYSDMLAALPIRKVLTALWIAQEHERQRRMMLN